MSGETGTDLVVENYRDGIGLGEVAVVEQVVVTEAWPAVDENQRRDIGFKIPQGPVDAVVGLEGLVDGGVVEGREAVVRTLEGGGHFERNSSVS